MEVVSTSNSTVEVIRGAAASTSPTNARSLCSKMQEMMSEKISEERRREIWRSY